MTLIVELFNYLNMTTNENTPVTMEDCLNKIGREKRIQQITELQSNFRPNSQKYFACEYMLMHPCMYVNQGDLLLYCDQRRCETTNGKHPNFRDNSRGIESLRKDKFPLRFHEVRDSNGLRFVYVPELEEIQKDQIAHVSHKRSGFSQALIKKKMKEVNYKCELTGLPLENGKLAADHWYPKEKSGVSTEENCVIINKILNEKKNNHEPVTWFCRFLLTNFLNICKKTGLDINSALKNSLNSNCFYIGALGSKKTHKKRIDRFYYKFSVNN